MRAPLGPAVTRSLGPRLGRALALLLWGLGAVAPAWGQTSNLPPEAPSIELYSGVRRIPDARPRPAAHAPAQVAPAPADPGAPKFMPTLYDLPPVLPEPAMTRAPAAPAELPPPLKKEDHAVVTAAATTPAPAPAEPPQAAPALASAATAAAADRPRLGEWVASVPWLRGALGQMIVLLGALAVVLLVLTMTFLTLLRWFGPILRVEFVNHGGGAYPLFVPHAAAGLPQAVPGGVVATIPDAVPLKDEEVVPNFELGPTYEEEQAMKAEAEQQQEQAVLQQVFEQNLQVLEEIDRMYGPFLAPEDGAAEPVLAGAAESAVPQEPAAA